MKACTWLIVANSSMARIFKLEKRDSLIEVGQFEHPESRLRNRDLISDKPGRTNESIGLTRHRYEQHHSPKHQEFETFAKYLAHHLDEARKKGEFNRLYLAASPNLLGLIRQSLDASTTKLLVGEVDKDMTHMRPDEILNHLPFLLTSL